MQIVNQREAASSNIFKHKEFNLESLGIGGLGAEFADIFRRAFASRVFPPHVTSRFCHSFFKQMLHYILYIFFSKFMFLDLADWE